MVEIENRCCECNSALYPCTNCGLKHCRIYYCDWCKEECETIYEYNGEEVCLDCIIGDLVKVQ